MFGDQGTALLRVAIVQPCHTAQQAGLICRHLDARGHAAAQVDLRCAAVEPAVAVERQHHLALQVDIPLLVPKRVADSARIHNR